jgi:SAM-dependent methyltransferase
VPYDPDKYRGTARYYVASRPAYSRALVATLTAEVRLDGNGRLLDVGCGPGVLALQLADYFTYVVGVDPDADMLAEASRCADEADVRNVRWVRGLAEELPQLDLGLDQGLFRLVTFGQSFHWTDQEPVAEAVYDLLEPGGAMVLIWHRYDESRIPPPDVGPGYPLIPHDAVQEVIERYLGPGSLGGHPGLTRLPDEPYAATLDRTRFGTIRRTFAPGRCDVVLSVDGVIARYLSTSFAAPYLFGDRLQAFTADVRETLSAYSSSGRFWEWPGDTEIVVAHKDEHGRR